MGLTTSDKQYLRGLAQRVAEIAADPYYAERREMWYDFNDLNPRRPMVLIFPEGAWSELLPDSTMKLEDPFWRSVEWWLRYTIYRGERLRDDNVIDPVFELSPSRGAAGWGLETRMKPTTTERGARAYDPVMKTPEDFAKMRRPHLVVNHEVNKRNYSRLYDAFGDILHIRWKRSPGINTSLVNFVCYLRGLEQVMVDMVDRPDWLHEVFSFLLENTRVLLDELEASGQLELMDGADYAGSGGTCYTRQLPASDYAGKARLKDTWGFAESQEYALISPRMYYEFGIKYQAPLLERFGLNCYGCCESLTDKLDLVIQHIPKLRRISISPWTDVRVAAEKLQNKYVFSWKPNPVCVSNPYDPQTIRASIRETLEITRGCVVEMILKDTHTCNNVPGRMEEWVRIALEEAERAAG
ncbi:MAG TPA: hypothetical protein PLM66_10440 [Candidatus Latescibacteria bacterium]|nr:hypothetical protein [Candidatus Latescibacterota bacterium]